ncbi:MAG: hypothetical protein HQM10_10645 [Candidatus Riflebacteria bacterium]|nr:hypothetical protein [Candidatus Riflebacteria bacterium]
MTYLRLFKGSMWIALVLIISVALSGCAPVGPGLPLFFAAMIGFIALINLNKDKKKPSYITDTNVPVSTATSTPPIIDISAATATDTYVASGTSADTSASASANLPPSIATDTSTEIIPPTITPDEDTTVVPPAVTVSTDTSDVKPPEIRIFSPSDRE